MSGVFSCSKLELLRKSLQPGNDSFQRFLSFFPDIFKVTQACGQALKLNVLFSDIRSRAFTASSFAVRLSIPALCDQPTDTEINFGLYSDDNHYFGLPIYRSALKAY